MLLAGIGETFTRNKRKWMIMNICEGNYTCETIDNKGLDKIVKSFTKSEMYKIFGDV
jgi:hypothetical protein